MSAAATTVIDGRAIAKDQLDEVAALHGDLQNGGLEPGLAVLLAGDDYAAMVYERRLRSLATTLSVYYTCESLPSDATEPEALAAVGKLNADPRITGILILRPLPAAIREERLFTLLDPGKDIEAVHPVNAGLLALGEPRFVPSTPAAVFAVLDRYLANANTDPASFYIRSTIVVVGRSNNVGKPALWLGLHRGASIVSCDRHAHDAGTLSSLTRRGDVVVVAAGVPGLITRDHLREGAIVIDVGINPVSSDRADCRPRLVGDVDTTGLEGYVQAFTPVPGGVGPVTDVCLLRNTMIATLNAADRAERRPC